MKNDEIKNELEKLKKELAAINNKKIDYSDYSDINVKDILNLIIEERERTNKMLEEISNKIRKLEAVIDSTFEDVSSNDQITIQQNEKEILLSETDTKIVNFIQERGMVTADDVKSYMGYKGKNAASSRLNRLYRDGLLLKYQLGHKVYYKIDAGKATTSLIITPPQ